jgi:hypothetical protein
MATGDSLHPSIPIPLLVSNMNCHAQLEETRVFRTIAHLHHTSVLIGLRGKKLQQGLWKVWSFHGDLEKGVCGILSLIQFPTWSSRT